MHFRSSTLVLSLFLLGGCFNNAPQVVKDASGLGVAQIEIHNEEVRSLTVMVQKILDAQLAAGRIPQEKHSEESDKLEGIIRRGANILELEKAIDGYLNEDIDWVSTVNEARHAVFD